MANHSTTSKRNEEVANTYSFNEYNQLYACEDDATLLLDHRLELYAYVRQRGVSEASRELFQASRLVSEVLCSEENGLNNCRLLISEDENKRHFIDRKLRKQLFNDEEIGYKALSAIIKRLETEDDYKAFIKFTIRDAKRCSQLFSQPANLQILLEGGTPAAWSELTNSQVNYLRKAFIHVLIAKTRNERNWIGKKNRRKINYTPAVISQIFATMNSENETIDALSFFMRDKKRKDGFFASSLINLAATVHSAVKPSSTEEAAALTLKKVLQSEDAAVKTNLKSVNQWQNLYQRGYQPTGLYYVGMYLFEHVTSWFKNWWNSKIVLEKNGKPTKVQVLDEFLAIAKNKVEMLETANKRLEIRVASGVDENLSKTASKLLAVELKSKVGAKQAQLKIAELEQENNKNLQQLVELRKNNNVAEANAWQTLVQTQDQVIQLENVIVQADVKIAGLKLQNDEAMQKIVTLEDNLRVLTEESATATSQGQVREQQLKDELVQADIRMAGLKLQNDEAMQKIAILEDKLRIFTEKSVTATAQGQVREQQLKDELVQADIRMAGLKLQNDKATQKVVTLRDDLRVLTEKSATAASQGQVREQQLKDELVQAGIKIAGLKLQNDKTTQKMLTLEDGLRVLTEKSATATSQWQVREQQSKDEIEQANAKIADLKLQNDKATQNVVTLENDLHALTEKSATATSQWQTRDQQSKDEIEQANAKIADLKLQNDKATQKVVTLEGDFRALTEESATATSQWQTREQQLKDELVQADIKMAGLKLQNDKVTQKMATLEDNLRVLARESATATSQWQTREQQLKSEIEQAHNKITNLEEVTRSVEQAKADVLRRVKQSEGEVASSATKVTELENQLKIMREQLAKSKQQSDVALQQITTLEAQIVAGTKRFQETTTQLQVAEQRLQEVVDQTARKISMFTEQNTAIAEQVTLLTNQNAKQNSQLAEQLATIQEQQVKLQENQQQIAQSSKQVADYPKHVTALTAEIELLKQDMERERNYADESAVQSRSEIDKIRKQMRREKSVADKKLLTASTNLSKLTMENDILKQQIDKLTQEVVAEKADMKKAAEQFCDQELTKLNVAIEARIKGALSRVELANDLWTKKYKATASPIGVPAHLAGVENELFRSATKVVASGMLDEVQETEMAVCLNSPIRPLSIGSSLMSPLAEDNLRMSSTSTCLQPLSPAELSATLPSNPSPLQLPSCDVSLEHSTSPLCALQNDNSASQLSSSVEGVATVESPLHDVRTSVSLNSPPAGNFSFESPSPKRKLSLLFTTPTLDPKDSKAQPNQQNHDLSPLLIPTT